ncbi:N-acetylglucosamine-6-phosphate deacetylase [Deinococcus sp.]|uniref:N-acetylglucosamine-6-phosphate deacetylase n=1 Tax=Deinococcus sp. TaxID=47478 RepID=UPI0025E3BB12|nr:N-acetylglucosamine-6-phosphate deacetylase [Deinococcus sp.]
MTSRVLAPAFLFKHLLSPDRCLVLLWSGMTILEGLLWTPRGWQSGRLRFESEIQEVQMQFPGTHLSETQLSGTQLRAAEPLGAPFIVPGFIDVHVHGGGGFDAMDGEDGVRGLARFHARHGTTALLATTITNPWERVLGALERVRAVQGAPQPGEASVLGAHLEGPFVNPLKLGAQPPFTLLPTPQRVAEVLAAGVVRVVTLAPELPGAVEAARQFARAGVRVSLGHTIATAEEAVAVTEAVLTEGGEVGGTHLFNAMSGLSGREPGVIGALLSRPATFAELILDGHHVHPTSFLSAHAAKPERMLLVTDAMRAAGMPDGDYDLGGQTATVRAGQARLAGGSLAGSLLTMDQALRGAVKAGLSLHRSVALASAHPARYLGLSDRGGLSAGQRADLVVLNGELKVVQVYVKGRAVL